MDLDNTISSTVEELKEAWGRFNAAESTMVEECIYELKMLETKLGRLLQEKKEVQL